MTYSSAASRGFQRTLLLDADDTLWENNIYYLRCTERFLEFMAACGAPPEASRRALDTAEHATVRVHGYGPRGYIAALGLACERLLAAQGFSATAEQIEAARAIGEPLWRMPIVLRPDVAETLPALRPTSRLVLVTKGDEEVQRDKIERSGLAPLLDAQYIVPEKDADTFRRVVAELGLESGHTWMVGNSPKSDINPAVRAGLGAILVPHDHTWGAELAELERPDLVVTLTRFGELAPFFGVES